MRGINTIGTIGITNTQGIFVLYTSIWLFFLGIIADDFPLMAWQFLFTCVLLVGFIGSRFSVDMEYTWNETERLQSLSWRQFLTSLPHTTYIAQHPPFFSWFLSKYRHYISWQLLGFGLSLVDLILLAHVYGWKTSFFIAATPLFCLMRTEPSNDLFAYSLCVMSLALSQYSLLLSGVVYGFAYCVKGTSLLTLPLMLYHIHIYCLVSCCIVIAFLLWSKQYRFYVLLHKSFFRHVDRVKRRYTLSRISKRFKRYSHEIKTLDIDIDKMRFHVALFYIWSVLFVPTPYRMTMIIVLACMRAAPKYYLMTLM